MTFLPQAKSVSFLQIYCAAFYCAAYRDWRNGAMYCLRHHMPPVAIAPAASAQ
jgi:hypothetical protein